MSVALTLYEPACRSIAAALEEARNVAEVLDVADRAEGLRAYAHAAGNRQLEIDAAEIRIVAEYKLGRQLIAEKARGALRDGRPPQNGSAGEPFPVRLADIGIDKKLSSRAQRLANLPPTQFEGMRAQWRERMEMDARRVTTSLLNERDRESERAAFAARTADGCTVADLASLAGQGARFGAILADPPWTFEVRSERGADRAAARHYATDSLRAIGELPVAALAAPDCALFLWTSGPHLAQATGLIEAWGFDFKTVGFAWMKLNRSGEGLFMGAGYWTRANCELVLLATRGSPKRLNADVCSALLAPVGEHSRKPDEVQNRIERLVGGPYLELYARRPRDGWTVWGNEIAPGEMNPPPARQPDAGDEPGWWAEARRMRLENARIIDIAAAVGRSPSSVCYALDPAGQNAKMNARRGYS
jgi:N6-adenosine-specific RNA methylase IME4